MFCWKGGTSSLCFVAKTLGLVVFWPQWKQPEVETSTETKQTSPIPWCRLASYSKDCRIDELWYRLSRNCNTHYHTRSSTRSLVWFLGSSLICATAVKSVFWFLRPGHLENKKHLAQVFVPSFNRSGSEKTSLWSPHVPGVRGLAAHCELFCTSFRGPGTCREASPCPSAPSRSLPCRLLPRNGQGSNMVWGRTRRKKNIFLSHEG